MSGNGVPTLGMKIIKVRLRMVVFGRLVEMIHSGCYAEVRGPTPPGTAVVRIVTATSRTSGSTTSVFE